MSRNRVIYQSKALFIAPNATGVQLWASGAATAADAKSQPELGSAAAGLSGYNGTGLLYKLDRVQNCNFNFTINRQDVNEFGKLARIGTIVNEPPTVTLDYSYYITDGLNERLMGFNFGGTTTGTAGAPAWDTAMVSGAGAISGFLSESQGQNYYILTVDEGEDVVGASVGATGSTDSVISIGNGFVTNYQFTASVGDVPTASVTVEGFNIKSDVGNSTPGVGYSGSSPAIYNGSATTPATRITGYNKYYKIDAAKIGTTAGTGAATVTALRPGDIVLTVPSASAAGEDTFVDVENIGTSAINIQSFGFSVPLARTTLSRLGALFGYNRVVNVPLNMDLTINALVASDEVLVPLQCEYFALHGFIELKGNIDKVRSFLNPELKLIGILATMYDKKTLHNREVLGAILEKYPEDVFETIISKTIRFAETTVAGEPITSYASSSGGAASYRRLARELIARGGAQ
jgi:hypothetical protein